MALFHFSESANIEAFEPRPPLRHPKAEALVYAIDEWHSPLYYFPPDCPRVAFWRLPSTSEEDTTRWLTASDTRMVIAIEWSWLTTLSEQALYRYEFDGKGLEDCQDHGVHVSRTSVKPDAVTEVTNLPGRLAEACVELRLCPSIVDLARALQSTSLHWSLIRMEKAVRWTGPRGKPVTKSTGF